MNDQACFHPRSCVKCDHAGGACGQHESGSAGHEECRGAADNA